MMMPSCYWKVSEISKRRKLEKELVGRVSKKSTKKLKIFSGRVFLNNLMKMKFPHSAHISPFFRQVQKYFYVFWSWERLWQIIIINIQICNMLCLCLCVLCFDLACNSLYKNIQPN